MASYLVIPDIHGRDKWRKSATEAVAEGKHLIFLGDYVDAYGLSDQQILDSFLDVLLLKTRYPEQVTLLLGNHDFPYISSYYTCSGNRASMWKYLNALFKDHAVHFQLAKQVGNTLFVHAGLTNGWLDYNQQRIEQQTQVGLVDYLQEYDYADLLNLVYNSADKQILYQVSRVHGGYDYYDGPVWVRPRQLLYDAIPGIHQVVGHTGIGKITSVTETALNDDTASVTFTDCMEHPMWEPLILKL